MFDWPGWLALLLAVVPAALRLLRTRSLLRHIDDPALPERLARRNLTGFAFAMAASLEIIVWPRYVLGTIPLLIVLFALAGWPLRRALFSETWSFPSYLWFYVRLVFAIYGFWIVLVWSAFLVDLNGTRAWAVAAFLGAVLLLWNEHYGRILRVILRTKPITTPSLVDRFNAIIAKTTVAPPDVEYVDMRGGTLVNALAVPQSKRPAVLFTSSLLERFDDDEVEAIFAHEVAHLEFYDPAFLKRWRVIGLLMILSTVFIRPLVQSVAPSYEGALVIWPIVVLLFMAARGGHKQKHETESDLRSAALTGNPEVMVRALIKLYEMMKMPRRLDPAIEVRASHPSLARRIQAIRAASGSIAAALPEPIAFRTGSTSVTLHADRLVWNEGDVTTYTLAYATLNELRVEPDAKGTMRLVASDPAGRKWTMPLDGDEVARAQAALNVVDVQLRPSPVGVSKWVALGRVAALLCVVVAIGATQFAALVVAALAQFSFERPLALAAGVASLTGGLLALRDGAQSQFAWMLALSALLLLFVAYRDTREVVSRTTWRMVSAIGVLALLLLIPIAVAGGDVLGVHRAARTWPGGVVYLLAFAVATMSRQEPKWKAAALAAVIIAGTSVAISSTRTLDALLDDPFLAEVEAVESEPLARTADAEVMVDFYAGEVLLSPSGLAVAVMGDEDQEHAIHVGKPGQALKEFRGNAALFIDDRRLLILDSVPGRAGLQLVDVDRLAATWEKTLDITSGALSIDRAATTWQVLGYSGKGRLVRITGPIDDGEIVRDEWRVTSADPESAAFPLWASGPRLIVRETAYNRMGLSWQRLGQWAMWLDPWDSDTRLLSIDGASARELWRSTLEVNCLPGSFADQPPICSGYDGSRTHLASLNPETGALTPIAKFPGGTVSLSFEREWVTGWVGARPFAWHVPSGRMIRLEDNRRANYEGYFVGGDQALAVIEADVDASTIQIYRGVFGSTATR